MILTVTLFIVATSLFAWLSLEYLGLAKQRFRRYSLRTLFALTTIVAVICGVVGFVIHELEHGQIVKVRPSDSNSQRNEVPL
jgi:hypothetical protein